MAEFRTVRGVIRNLKGVTEKVITKLGLDITANLIETTPVDTGWARANWVPSVGAPALDGSGVSKAGRGLISGASSSQMAAQASLATSGYKLSQGRLFISNGVPYIELLNSGSSKQAPRGFVQRAIQKAVTKDIKVRN